MPDFSQDSSQEASGKGSCKIPTCVKPYVTNNPKYIADDPEYSLAQFCHVFGQLLVNR